MHFSTGNGGGYGVTPDQAHEKAEFSWSRLRYTSRMSRFGGGGYGYGYGYGSWSRDYPKADRQFLIALKRLTRIQWPFHRTGGRSRHNDGDIYNYPWVYAVQVQTWTFTDAEAKRLREYLLKGGFLMVDDFHGTADWESFMEACAWFFRTAPIEDLENKDEIFHVLYDLDDRFQVPGEQYVNTGRTYEKDGYVPKWRAIRDDKGRIDRGHLPQHASWRRLGMGGRSRSIRRTLRRWLFASGSTTSFTE